MSCVKEVRRLCPSVYILDGEYTIVDTAKIPLWSVLVSTYCSVTMIHSWCNDTFMVYFMLDPNVTDQFAIRLVDDDGNISSSNGGVEVLHAGVWGSVCNAYWDITDANVVCRQLNYSHAIQATRY